MLVLSKVAGTYQKLIEVEITLLVATALHGANVSDEMRCSTTFSSVHLLHLSFQHCRFCPFEKFVGKGISLNGEDVEGCHSNHCHYHCGNEVETVR